MFEAAVNAWRIADLRKKIFYTLFIILIFRIGSHISVPFVNVDVFGNALNNANNGLIGYLSILGGNALKKASLFSLGVSPYVTSSIVIQLLTVAIPALERMQKEGEVGRKKINTITRYVTIGLAAISGYGTYALLRSGMGTGETMLKQDNFFVALVIVVTLMAGSTLIMWMGEQVNEKGIGNGISIILFAGIVASGPSLVTFFINKISAGGYLVAALVAVISLAMITMIVIMNDAERRLPINYAKRVVGRKMYGGQNTHLPMKVNMTGVMPIIFAVTLVSLPTQITAFFPGGVNDWFMKYFGQKSIAYAVLYFLLIIAFNYFYVSIQYNPIEIANNLQKNGGNIPGIRSGQPTADYIKKTLGKITLLGAIFLGIVAVLPVILQIIYKNDPSMSNLTIGGTSLLIAVSVVLETMKQLESQLLMRHYKGFLE